jgi:hypothetical protein
VIRAEEVLLELDPQLFQSLSEPLGVIAQNYTMEFPYFNGCMETSSSACRKYSGAKTSRKYSISILVLMELIGDILPPGC